MGIRVSLQISPGGRNPTWDLNEVQITTFLQMLRDNPKTTSARPPGDKKEAYKGFEIESSDIRDIPKLVDSGVLDFGPGKTAQLGPGFEYWLLDTAIDADVLHPDDPAYVRCLIGDDIAAFKRIQTLNGRFVHLLTSLLEFLTTLIRRSLIKTNYRPEVWRTHRTCNNCYNYAVDQQRNNYAQPGQASNTSFTAGDCISTGHAAEMDGLTPLDRSKLDTALAGDGHAVALLMQKGRRYHFLRLDSNGIWSHKALQRIRCMWLLPM